MFLFFEAGVLCVALTGAHSVDESVLELTKICPLPGSASPVLGLKVWYTEISESEEEERKGPLRPRVGVRKPEAQA